MLYEGREGCGQIIVAAPRHPNVFPEIALRTRIDLRDFGLTWNAALETGGVLVSNEIKIHIEAQAVRAA